MHSIDNWLEDISAWYDNENLQYPVLAQLIKSPPAELFSSPVSPEKSDSLAYFFDACFKLHRHEESQLNTDSAYSYLHFSYAKLQQLASHSSSEVDVRRWSIKKLDQVIVAMMEFCQKQGSDDWLKESEMLVELHISFMLGQSNLNVS
ncbi:hypothetical protein [Enterovibrio nigricans]|uniref:Transcriptional regulator n=1 Tax=Enterovibrio nigricans DSM 22720 TaxID=1121868 RepID=A0A1T4ULD6_9GAMM|nr:hypothetical protein [Enterovibrio nigricans]PKF49462.1 hypothetical protein AT251_18625 [Enterovibrio nigricans]SKA53410.1 hypothetical protein SAMN02745132_01963 [Enterovibrio nigricans DSM 22720]